MIDRRQPRPRTRPPLGPILVLVGALVGLVAARQVVDRIGEARMIGIVGYPAAVVAEPEPAKPSEEDDRLARALAAAIGARTQADCRSFEPQHRRGCRAFVERRRRDALDHVRPDVPPTAGRNLAGPGAPSR